MSVVRPFRALHYDPARVDLSRVIVPPYDVVADADRETFYGGDPHNAIRLELTRDVSDEPDADYAEVRRTLECWLAEGVLAREAQSALYGLQQRFLAPDGSDRVREGFFALLHLEEYARRIVRPHERTLAGPKADRLKMLRAARANLSSVFLLYEDREQRLSDCLAADFETAGLATARDDSGARHTLTRVADPERIDAVCAFMAGRSVVIADGHHRYETALAYRDERRSAGAGEDGPHEWILAYFANAYAPGNLLLPIHRLIRKGAVPTEAAWSERLPGWTQRVVAVDRADAIPGVLADELAPLAQRHAFAADDGSGRLRIFSRERGDDSELSVRVIHREVIGGVFGLDEAAVREGAIDYPKSAIQTARDLRAGRGSVAIYLHPLTSEDVFRVTAAGDVLPQKSTFFYPKLPTGLVFRDLEEPE